MIYAESLLSIGFVFLSVIVVIGMIKNRDIILNWVSTKNGCQKGVSRHLKTQLKSHQILRISKKYELILYF